MKLTILIGLLFGLSLFGQNPQNSLFHNSYLSAESNYRSYGTNDHRGVGGGVEISKDIKYWLGVGLNLSYFKHHSIDLNLRDPFTNQNITFNKEIEEFLVSPFLQIFPLNTQHFDFYVQLGLRTGYYNQTYYTGSIATDTDNGIFSVDLNDIGNKGMTLGYTAGAGIRFQFQHFIIVPNIILISNDLNGDSFSSINLKMGWQL